MIDTKAIRAKVLDLAIRGKLTEQRPEDGTAEELYRRIQADKQSFIKDTKSKPLTSVEKSEMLFDAPMNWVWVRFASITINHDGKRKPVTKSDRVSVYGTYEYFGATGAIDRVDDYLFDGDYLMIGEDGGNFFTDRPNSFIATGKFWANNHVHVIQPVLISIWYLKYVIDSYNLPKMGLIRGLAAPKLNQANLNSIPIPLPPLPEQHRIVARIDAIFSLLDTIDALQSAYTANQKALRAKLIDAAIRGQLTEQLPEDGTAEELYQQIQAEKAALEKAGKIKKSKPLPPVTEEEKPFEIPGNWKWVRFSDLMLTISTGPFGSMLHKSDYVNNGIPLVNPMNIVSGRIIPSDKMMVSEESRLRLASYVLHEGMIVMGRRGEMGRCAIVNQNENGWLCGTGSFFMEPSNCILVQYVIILLSTIYAKTYLGGQSIGMTMSNLNHTILTKMPIPLPPLAEQKRIVARLEELLAVCEG